ncbi:WD40 repeat-like protein [Leucogyrophana mollusca]|uniref:WD40 repeat-like protein n=1 Tax=Leucogyrophana mollusca TaxID=85980 RepID=A0ACB8AY24_9AGAM|nr:WD40 repeat-like protein [Leucogyrophana mollusca]
MPLLAATKSEKQYRTKVLKGHKNIVNCLAYTPDGRYLISGSFDNTVRVWDVHTGKTIGSPLKGRATSSLVVTPDGKKVVMAASGVTVWALESGIPTRILETLPPFPFYPVGGVSSVRHPIISPDGHRAISVSNETIVYMRDIRTGKSVIEPIEFPVDNLLSVVWSSDGKKFATYSEDATLRVWDAVTGRLSVKPFQVEGSPCHCIFSRDDQQLVCIGDGRIWIADARDGRRIPGSSVDHESPGIYVALSPDGRRIASCSAYSTVCISDVTTGECIANPLGFSTPRRFWAFSPDGKLIASTFEKDIEIWDVEAAIADYRASNQPTQIGALQADTPHALARASNDRNGLMRLFDRFFSSLRGSLVNPFA